ncbi:MAG: YybS family protein [Magnetovibrio sp.]|nr:YybS family protein [Magnetovibrio sp.]
MKHTILAILAGIVSGALALATMSGASFAILFLSLVHTLPLYYAGLSLGTRPAMIAAASSVLSLSLISPNMGMVFGVLYAVPAWVIIRLTLSGPQGVVTDVPEGQSPPTEPSDLGWFPVGYIVAVLAAIGGLFVLGASLLTGGGLEQAINEVLQDFAKLIGSQSKGSAQDEAVLEQAVLSLVPYFAGSAAAMWALGQAINMVFAQGLLAKGGRNIRPTPRLRDLTLPDALSWALVLMAVVALAAPGELGYIGRNIAIVLAVPFFFLGLAVVHKLAAMTPMKGPVLALVYLVMIFTGWMAFIVAGLGILEQWIGLRNRMDQPD